MTSVSPDSDDPELLRRMGRGDIDALAAFYDRYSDLLFSLAFRILGDEPSAAEVVQETFLHIWENNAQFAQVTGNGQPWLVSQARNRAVARLRARKRYREIQREPADQSPGVSAEANLADESMFPPARRERIRSALDSLTDEQREVIDLAFFSGLTQTEIAGVLQKSTRSVKDSIRGGMIQLRMSMESED